MIVDHALYELEGFDEIRALLDKKYRNEQEKIRERKINAATEINPIVIFPEDDDESEQ